MGIFYHRLWFWEGEHLPIASFCQKLFLLEAGFGRFSARWQVWDTGRVVHNVGVPLRMRRHKG